MRIAYGCERGSSSGKGAGDTDRDTCLEENPHLAADAAKGLRIGASAWQRSHSPPLAPTSRSGHHSAPPRCRRLPIMHTALVLRFCLLAASAATAPACTGAGYQAAERSLQEVADSSAPLATTAPLAPTKQAPNPEPVIAPAPPAPVAAEAPPQTPTSAPSAPSKSPPAAVAPAPPKPAGDTAPANMHYGCPMDPQIKQATPGRCPICEMRLVLRKDEPAEGSGVDAKP